jgi:hypothetical protein
MRYAIFGALILSLEIFGASVAAAAMPTSGNAVVNADLSKNVIQVYAGCGLKFNPIGRRASASLTSLVVSLSPHAPPIPRLGWHPCSRRPW